MRTAKEVNDLVQQWKNDGVPGPELVVKTANECIGWPYVFGGRGEYCTPANRKARYNPKYPTIYSKCQVLRDTNKKDNCTGCKWHPGGTTLFYDCRGFTYWLFKLINIEIKGGGATSQWNDDSNWEIKGTIDQMPKDKVCCVFRYDNNTKLMEHTLLYDGAGHYIHCSGEVKKCDISKYNATHYAIPKGLYSDVKPDPKETAVVYAENGKPVKMRDKPSVTCLSFIQIKCGETVEVMEYGEDWTHIRYKGRKGYMMTKFLIFGDEPTRTYYSCTIHGLTKEQADALKKQYPNAIITQE